MNFYRNRILLDSIEIIRKNGPMHVRALRFHLFELKGVAIDSYTLSNILSREGKSLLRADFEKPETYMGIVKVYDLRSERK